MNKLSIVLLLSLVLAGCGGSSDKNTAEEPPAPDMSGDGGASGTGGGAASDQLALSCSKQPGTTINSGSAAKATFAFNQAINTTGVITMSCSNNGALFAPKNVNVISGQVLEQQTVPAGCEQSTFIIKLTVNEDNLSASCSWPVNKTLGFG